MITEYPLTKSHRIILARAFVNVPRVDMSIQCVVEGQMGSATVDSIDKPTVFKIEVGPFIYFAGNVKSPAGKAMLKTIAPYTLFMPSSPGWIEAARKMYGDKLVELERYSFSQNHLSIEHLEELIRKSIWKKVKPMDLSFARKLWGKVHFIELSDFDSPEDFVKRGIGYYLEQDNRILGAAYSSLVCSMGIEVSIFVREDYRRQGIATTLASHLLLWCLNNHTLASWDTANHESCKLALKMGYTYTRTYKAYYLKPE
ncbi:MAG: hypothetical protein APR63_06120 [Desulfuromonas sp. SDB]|nr:MAG: hypothetical protein APR63_06120 [Desulfuromonas sp. SDB]